MSTAKDFDWLPLAAVRPWQKNPRKNKRACAPVAASIKQWGFVAPVVVWLGGDRMVAGHTRIMALQSLLAKDPGFVPPGAPGSGLVPVRFQDFKSEAEADAYALADNRLAEIAEWDEGALPGILRGIQEADASLLALTGWTDAQMANLLRSGVEGDPDDEAPVDRADELQRKWQTDRGQLWEVPSRATPGRAHRILCGDSTDAADVEKLRGGAKWQLMVTDPPYGVNYDASWRNTIPGDALAGYAPRSLGKVQNDHEADWTGTWTLFAPEVAYVWHASMLTGVVGASLETGGMHLRSHIIWRKPHFVIGRAEYHWQHESALYAVRKGSKSGWCGDRTQSTLWEIKGMIPTGGSRDEGDARTGHSTQKPIECMQRPIRNHFEPGIIVCDPFLGSGTTLVSAERERRICYGQELSAGYLAVILERMTTLGLEPKLL
jgi:DNA modification methylase